MSCIQFTVNGVQCKVDARVPWDTTLNAYLRYHLSLPGTKSMCLQGGCGACVVAVRAYNQTTGTKKIFSVNSCLILVFSCHGWDITTIEGLGNRKDGYHPIQLRTAACHATQCGYCTCGWEMQLFSLLDKNLTMAEIEESFGSNICRCTGYRPILDTAKSFAVDASVELCDKFCGIENQPNCKQSPKNCDRKCSLTESEWIVIDELAISDQINDVGTPAGNLVLKHKTPAFQSDIFVLFETVRATMKIRDMYGRERILSMTEFLKYDMYGVLIVSFQLPPLGRSHVFRSYKIAPRSQNSSALLNVGFLLKINSKSIVEDASIVYGNISESFVHAVCTEEYLMGKNIFTNEVLQGALEVLDGEIHPAHDPAKPTSFTRKKLATGLFYKFVLNTSPKGSISPRLRSGAHLLERPISSGKQEYQTNSSMYPVTQPVEKYEGLIQSSGEAHYANDLPSMKNEVFGSFVLSTSYCGEVECIDASEVLKLDGVLALYTAKDIPGPNTFVVPGLPLEDKPEEILVTKKISFYGQPIAIVVAETQALAAMAATKVRVTYKNVSNTTPVVTIDEAKKSSDRFIPNAAKIEPKGRGSNTSKVIKGVFEIGAQYHYYIEPLTCVVVPVDRGLEVYDSSQWIDLTQIAIARCLNMKESDILVKMRRVGGAFGGKISRNAQIATACALVAKKLDRPCRFILPMSTNMAMVGKRLPCQCEYEVGVDDAGRIQYLDASLIEDVGCSNNESVVQYTIDAFPNVYNKDYFNVKSAEVLTDLPSNTFFRGPGAVEGIACMENIMEHIAFAVNKDPTEVRLANMRTNDKDIPELVDFLKKKSEYERRFIEIQQFNRANRWVKKAIKISLMVFHVMYYGNYSVMVSIFRDGSVSITTGGNEIGQGANTKVRQVVAYALGVNLEMVSVSPNLSIISANNCFTGSSIVSECMCYAADKVCDILNIRLQPVIDSLGDVPWTEIIKKAYDSQINLVAEYMMTDKDPNLHKYDAFGVAILEGELDVLTGKYILNRLDLVEDAGESTNPAIDIGQIEGAYVQGISYFTTEKVSYDIKTGKLLTNNGMTYHPSLAQDIPVVMNVSLKSNSKNSKGVLGSKAVGEMGICTAHGVMHVLRECIMESRKESGYDPHQWINIDAPYTTEAILKALNVKSSELVLKQ